jgi:hypothetical protein
LRATRREDTIKPIQIDLSQYEQLTRALRPLDSLFVEDCEMASLEVAVPPVEHEFKVLPDPETQWSLTDESLSNPII